MKINKEKIEKNVGIYCKNDDDYIEYMRLNLGIILDYHNKNLTRQQYNIINECFNILENMEVKDNENDMSCISNR